MKLHFSLDWSQSERATRKGDGPLKDRNLCGQVHRPGQRASQAWAWTGETLEGGEMGEATENIRFIHEVLQGL